jgi:hypothetical protein
VVEDGVQALRREDSRSESSRAAPTIESRFLTAAARRFGMTSHWASFGAPERACPELVEGRALSNRGPWIWKCYATQGPPDAPLKRRSSTCLLSAIAAVNRCATQSQDPNAFSKHFFRASLERTAEGGCPHMFRNGRFLLARYARAPIGTLRSFVRAKDALSQDDNWGWMSR